MSMWERIAARTGGTVAGLALGVGPDGDRLVFAATPTGVFRSSDGGRLWAATSAGTAVPFATAVAASPELARDGTLFAAARDAVYRSRDGGRAWDRVLIGGPIFAIAVSPTYADDRTLFVATAEDGVLRSEDGGTSWSGANAGLLDLTVLALALSPRFADDRTAFVGTASGLYRSRNGARSWREVDLTPGEVSVQALAISLDFARDRLVFAGTEEDGLLRSDDSGVTWEAVEALAGRGVTAVALSARRGEPPLIAAATESTVLLSDDGGEAWRETAPLPAPALALAFSQMPVEGGLLVGLAGRGVARLGADGRTWESANDGLFATPLAMLAVAPPVGRDLTLFAASSDGLVLTSGDAGATWAEWDVELDEPALAGLALSPRFADDRTAWVAASAGLYRSRDAGASWARLPVEVPSADTFAAGPASRDDESTESLPLRSLSVALPRGDGGPILYAAGATGDLLTSPDAGETWQSLGPVSSGADLMSVAASPAFAADRALFAVTSGAVGPDGAGGLVLWRSADGGAHWERWFEVPGVGLLPLAIPATHWRDGTVFVGAGRHVFTPIPRTRERREGASRPLWRATDLGSDVMSVVALATPPGRDAGHVVFAATNAGIYVSRDDGRSFAPWSEGLDPTSVVALATAPSFEQDRLVFAVGLGGTIWRRRDEG